MGIRIEHQMSAVGGIAAYAAGRGRALVRTQKQVLDFQRDKMLIRARQQGLGYRRHLAGMRQGSTGVQALVQGTTIDDPATGADPANLVRINAQREANARAGRMGKPAPYPDAEPRTILPPTPAEERREEAERGREFQRELAEGRSRVAGEKEDLGFLEMKDAETKSRIGAIREATGGAFDDPEMTKAWKSMDQVVTMAEADKNGDGRLSAAERYQARIESRQKAIDLYDPGEHDVPFEDRPGNEYIDKYGRQMRKPVDPNEAPTFHGMAPDSQLTPEQKQGKQDWIEAQQYTDPKTGRTGQIRQDSYGQHIEWDDVDKGQTAAEWNQEWSAYHKAEADYMKRLPEDATPKQKTAAKKEFEKIYQKPFQDQQPALGDAGLDAPAVDGAPKQQQPEMPASTKRLLETFGVNVPELPAAAEPPAAPAVPGAVGVQEFDAATGELVPQQPDGLAAAAPQQLAEAPETLLPDDPPGTKAEAARRQQQQRQQQQREGTAFREEFLAAQGHEGFLKTQGHAAEPGRLGQNAEPESIVPDRPHGTPPPRPGRPGYKAWIKKVEERYEQLPSGTIFVGPDGKQRRKP